MLLESALHVILFSARHTDVYNVIQVQPRTVFVQDIDAAGEFRNVFNHIDCTEFLSILNDSEGVAGMIN